METIGFKSFAERVQIEFVPGVTAIVGPNGSGKSNIIDAIRWVLGEQSARALRGQKMEDIIFQGSDTRKALNFAEVSLVLNNENGHLPIDYQEVNVTRRVFRSGESEFFMNKQACRLKDIVDLFTDTGLGRESFSIIGQGKIDEILSSKADERRAVFEEAAGVLKYKQRKQRATYKLTETESNLDRVKDIIHEISQQMGPLKEQSQIARKYQSLKAQLTDKEISLFVTEIEQLHEEWNAILLVIENKKQEEIAKKTEIQKREANITKERQHLQTLEQELTTLQNNVLHITERLEQDEGKRNVLLEQKKHQQENKQKLFTEKLLLEQQIADTKQSISTELGQLTKIKQTLQTITKEIKQIESKLLGGVDTVKTKIEDLKSDYIEHLNKQAVLQNECTTWKKQMNQIEKKIVREQAEHHEILQKEKNILQLGHEISSTLSTLEDEITASESALQTAKTKVSNERKTYEDMQNKLFAGNEQIARLSSRLEMLIEMKESFQGYAYGVREILRANNAGILEQIDGAVIDLIQVPTKYMTAIDTILGAQAQYIVVPSDEVARKTIHWLKKENKGRATFLPLQSIVARHIPDSVRQSIHQHPGFLGIASELIEIAPAYNKVTNHLMGNVIVTKTLEDANHIADLTNRRYRIVTLEGDIVFPGGSMSGGAKRKANQSLFTREKEMSELKGKIAEFMNRAKQYEQKVTEKKNTIDELEHSLILQEDKIKKSKELLQKQQTEKSEWIIMKKSVQDQLTTYRFHVQQFEEEKQMLSNNYKQTSKQLREITELIKQSEQKITQLTNEQQLIEKNEKRLQVDLHQLQLKSTELEERKRNHEEKNSMLKKQLEDLEKDYQKVMVEMQNIVQAEQNKLSETELTNQIESYRNERQETTAEIKSVRHERQKKLQWVEDEITNLQAEQRLHEQFVRAIQEKEVQANRLDVMLDNLLNALQVEYVTTYENAAKTYEKVADVDSAKQEVKELKGSIERLGTVNIGAIEEYERLTERYNFLKEQEQDLIEAKQTLYDAIKEMDEEMATRFKAMFEKIQSAFTDVFKQLFGGGNAELVLTDPTNYLETGIEIVARPPGKKLKTLGLLSGGERALTAIALLFAILKARPVPFVILDEVDAALDEANVERFGAYLNSFSDESQFIVISHRKGTMEQADALYGVTMQELGVSRLVSVRLEDADEVVGVM